MAEKVEIRLTDDLDDSKADSTVRFGLDGNDYEIDLTAAHAQQLRSALDSYRQAARRVAGGAHDTRSEAAYQALSDRVSDNFDLQ